MKLLDALRPRLEDGEILDVCVGLHWTAVVARAGGETRCGLSSTLTTAHDHTAEPDVPVAGRVHTLSRGELAGWANSDQPIQASIGVATMNALLPRLPQRWHDLNAEEMIAVLGKNKTVALVGGFPFVSRLRLRVGSLTVLERQPKDDELPAEAASDILPNAEVVAITSMSLVNHSLDGLLSLCTPESKILLLGPSTPLSPVLHEVGIDVLSGAIVTDIEAVMSAVRQGGNFRQVHRAGARLVTMTREP